MYILDWGGKVLHYCKKEKGLGIEKSLILDSDKN